MTSSRLRCFVCLGILLGSALDDAVSADRSFGTAQWIWSKIERKDGLAPAFQKTFDIAGPIDRAELRVAADFATLQVRLNQQPVGAVDNYSYPQAFDVAAQLRVGENRLDLGAKGSPGPSAVALLLDIVLKDGSRQTIVSDDSWHASFGLQNETLKVGPVAADRWTDLSPDTAISPFDDYEQWRQATGAKQGADPAKFSVAEGFEIELVHSAAADEGSWVSIACDPQGRFVIGREDKGLLRLALPTAESKANVVQVETINDTLQECRGLLFAHNSLYTIANTSQAMYRLRDSDGDGRHEQVDELFKLSGKSGHGRNGLALGPDDRVHLICGDSVDLPTDVKDRTSPFTEHRRGEKTKEGYVLAFDADGKNREIICTGLRNPYGIAFNADGEPFTYDADAEFDMGSPWYRPTRVLHLASGSDFGWRGVTGDWPPYFPDHADNAPPVLDIGKGSPTNVMFGTASNFPTRYRQALFLLDWAYGRIIAVDLEPRGASYVGKATTFVKGRPFNATSLTFGRDGAMYVVTGGRKTQSGLYRIRYTGKPQAEPEPTPQQIARRKFAAEQRETRRKIESLHTGEAKVDFDALRPSLGSDDPRIRYAARTAVEHQPLDRWRQRALKSFAGWESLTWTTALVRTHDAIIASKLTLLPARLIGNAAQIETAEQGRAFFSNVLAVGEQMQSDSATRDAWRSSLTSILDILGNSTETARPDELLSRLAASAKTDFVVADLISHLQRTDEQREQMLDLFLLRDQPTGWTDERRMIYFQKLATARHWQGGEGMPRFIQRITDDALASVPEAERAKYAAIVAPQSMPADDSPLVTTRPVVQAWKAKDVASLLMKTKQKASVERGKELFAAALCIRCHRFGTSGHAVGPDLTGLARRFSRRDMLESIILPSKVIAEQYRTVQIETSDGRLVVGRILSEGDYRSTKLRIAVNPLDPRQVTDVEKSAIESHTLTNTSLMPEGLLNTLSADEIRDLLAYLETAGVAP